MIQLITFAPQSISVPITNPIAYPILYGRSVKNCTIESIICDTTSDAVSSIEAPHSAKLSASELIASTIFPGNPENHSTTESMNFPMLSRTPENHSAIAEPISLSLSGIPLKKSTIWSQCSLMRTTAVATAATIAAIAAATSAGAPSITAPTAASAIPTTIRTSFMALKPLTNMSMKLVTARIAPAIIEPIPAIEEPNSVKNPITF